MLSESSAKARRRDGTGAYNTRRRRLYDTCTHQRNTASAHWGIFSRRPCIALSCAPIGSEKPNYFRGPKGCVPQLPIRRATLSSFHGD